MSKELAIPCKVNSFDAIVPKPVFASESPGDLNSDSKAHSRCTESKLGGKGWGGNLKLPEFISWFYYLLPG